MPAAAFAALRSPTYRTYLAGYAASAIGTWTRSVAQDWLVLDLTHDPGAVGVTMACQFLPVLLLGLHGGLVADRWPRRALLLGVEAANAVLALLLAFLALAGTVRALDVDLVALAGGLVLVVDNPARNALVGQVAPVGQLRTAVALAAAVFHTARLVGPAAAALLIASAGTGWAFVATAACSLASAAALARLRPTTSAPVLVRAPGQVRAALRHVAARPAVTVTIVLVGVVGTFGLNFPVVLTGMAGPVFDGGPALYGLFNVVLAVGSVAGALLAAGARSYRPSLVAVTAAGFGLAQLAASQAPGRATFLVALLLMGGFNLAFQALATTAVQTGVDPAVRGRVMGLYALAFTGGTPIGAPLVGAVTDVAGPRVGMALCGAVPLVVAMAVVARAASLRDRRSSGSGHTGDAAC